MSFVIITFSALFIACASPTQQVDSQREAQPVVQLDTANLEEATLAGGCFWCVEAVLERLKGVSSVVSGYAGGKEANPSYEDVSYGRTNYAEAVRVYFDPKVISYKEVLEVFFTLHNPTQKDGQTPDLGRQYRSAVFYHNDAQKQVLEAYVKELNASGKYDKPIVTEIEALTTFYPAEDYHQNFYVNHPNHPYILQWLVPKLKKEDKYFADKIQKGK